MDNTRYTFEDIAERDIDMLLMEEFGNNPEFLKYVLSRSKEYAAAEINIDKLKVVEVIHSSVEPGYGESDVVVIYEYEGVKHGLLIEDKINAKAMDKQASRYTDRAEIAVQRGDYKDYVIFIVAPEMYINDKNEAAEVHKYPNKLTYQDIAEHGHITSFHIQQIERATKKQKAGYTVVRNDALTKAWADYKGYVDEYFGDLNLHEFASVRGSSADWLKFDTWINGVYIYHKTNPSKANQGSIELAFNMNQDNISDLEDYLKQCVGDFYSLGYRLVPCGKSQVTLVKRVPLLDLKTFDLENLEDEQLNILETCLQAVREMNNIVKKLRPKETEKKLLEWQKK